MKTLVVTVRRSPAPFRIGCFALILLLLWLPIALPLHWLIRDRNLATILTLLILYAEFIWLVRQWGKRVHRQPRILREYGLEFSQRNGRDLLTGLGVGLTSALLLFVVQGFLGWIQWQPVSLGTAQIILEGLFISLALGFAEELLFRGWLLDELQRDYVPIVALWANAVLFAALHLRLWTFPALVLLGVALVWAKRSRPEWTLGKRRERLGLPMGLHAGLVWGNYIVEVGKLIQYTNRVPAWVTGLDRNPLAGVMGVLFLGALAFGMWRYAIAQQNR
ncbi:MAG: CPBP family intramembrane metalloprotease [Oscillatoriales cyanobacterium C42_A2020_001]|nr:CPBP family intramembrane metalloprotease [Leptolyngbyaceae cyanobacterium C42_A2020_001]